MPRDDDEDDDRPRSRRLPRDEDEDDDRPKARRSRDEDEDDDRPKARRRAAYDDSEEEDYDDRPRQKRQKPKGGPVSTISGVALGLGVVALLLSFSCFAWLAVIPGLIGVVLGIMGFVSAQKRRGREIVLVPLGGVVLSLAACVVVVISMFSFAGKVKNLQKDMQTEMAKVEQEEAARRREVANAAGEVRAAAGGLQVTAAQFFRAYEDDEDRADALYKNKIIELTGSVDELNFAGDTYTVMLKGGRPDETVDCEFAKDPAVRARLAQLKPGDPVRIRGKCLGGSATLEACVLVE